MSDTRNDDQLWKDTIGCPVLGGAVTVWANYRHDAPGLLSLVDFSCSAEGSCGIPDWDPCPLFVRCLEREHAREPSP